MTKVFVFVMNKNRALVVASGKWLIDTKSPEEKEAVAKSQRTTSDDPYYAFADLFATKPEGTLMPKVTQKEGYFTTRFISTLHPNPPGFIKGDIEAGESPLQSAVREFKEETFTELPTSRFVEVSPNTNVYRVDLTDEEAEGVYRTWETHFNHGLGELVSLTWTPVADVHRAKISLNPDSQSVLRYLPTSGGRRTRRRMLKKPKSLKKRIR